MNPSVAPYPRFRSFLPATATPNSGGFLYTAVPGTLVVPNQQIPQYPATTYTDSTAQMQNPNPIVLDASGEADVWLSDYTKLVLTNAQNNVIWSVDNVSSSPLPSPTTSQWVTQASQAVFIDATHFSVPGNQTASFVPGTRLQTTISGGSIYGTVFASSSGGTPVVTTVTVVWDSTALNSSVTSVALGIILAGVGSLPINPPIIHTGNVTLAPSDLNHIHQFNSLTPCTAIIQAAGTVAPGSWYRLKNVSTGVVSITGQTIDGVPVTLGQYNEIWPYGDGTSWYGKRI